MASVLELLDRLEHSLVLTTPLLVNPTTDSIAEAADRVWDARAAVNALKLAIDRERPITGEYKKLDPP